MIRDYRCIIAVWKSCLELSGLNAGFAEYIDIYILLLCLSELQCSNVVFGL
jgi:hypothetical protein